MDAIDRHLGVLGLRRGVSKEELKTAYRALIQVSHPDRFFDDEALKKQAEGQTRALNEAYRYLREHFDTVSAPATPDAGGVTADAGRNGGPSADAEIRAGRLRSEEEKRRQDAEYRDRKRLREEREAWQRRRLKEQRKREAQTWFLGILFVILLLLLSAHNRRQANARRPPEPPTFGDEFEPADRTTDGANDDPAPDP